MTVARGTQPPARVPALTRRRLLGAGLGSLATLLARPIAGWSAPRERFLIVNADDLGLSAEIDRGIFEAHDSGIVTSASLMVDGEGVEATIKEARRRPKLGLGIHVTLEAQGKRLFDAYDLELAQREIDRQLERFVRLTGAPPDHIDSHHHVHRRFNIARLFLDAGRRFRVPVRGFSDVLFLGWFYGQPEFGKTDLSRVGVDPLLAILRLLKPGVSELSCHPGHLDTRPDLVYTREREVELRTLTDERVKAAITDEGIRLINYRDYARLRSG
jgi:predicted glycoside hydrolase/deacetylase ChbG (UPF0249 family)